MPGPDGATAETATHVTVVRPDVQPAARIVEHRCRGLPGLERQFLLRHQVDHLADEERPPGVGALLPLRPVREGRERERQDQRTDHLLLALVRRGGRLAGGLRDRRRR